MKSLSPTMAACLALAQSAPDETLIRYYGGYWAPRGAAMKPKSTFEPYPPPLEYFGINTVHALVTRGYMEFCEHRRNRDGEFAVAARIKQDQPS